MSYYFPNNFEIFALIVQFHQHEGGEIPIFILEFNVLLGNTNEIHSFQFLVDEVDGLMELVGIGAVGKLEQNFGKVVQFKLLVVLDNFPDYKINFP